MELTTEKMAKNIVSEWGWMTPTDEVIRLAELAIEAKHCQSATLLVKMGLITEQEKDKWLQTKPAHIKTFMWFAQQKPILAPYVESVITLKTGFPFYRNLEILQPHPCMYKPGIGKMCDEMDLAVMLIESKTPVVVFSSFAGLIKFNSMGRAESQKNPIISEIGKPKLAVGKRDQISFATKKIRSKEESVNSLELLNLWSAPSDASNVETREFSRLVDHALTIGATDISISPKRSGEFFVQMRKFGEMIAPATVDEYLPQELGSKLLTLLQSRSGANPTATTQRLPTDGHISYQSTAGDTFLRLSFVPMNHLGEYRNLTSISIRLLPRVDANINLQSLSLHPKVIEQVHFAMKMSQGLVLIAGPTNSGKSTTIAGAITEHVNLFGSKRKRLSIEDPIERFLSGIQQYNAPLQVHDESKRFEIILRAFKRHDPDMIWVGEVRDKATADLCVASASTGHLVVSTLHANDAVMAFDVLAKMIHAEKRFQLIESMSLVVSQRLLKSVCTHCRDIGAPTHEEKRWFEKYCELTGDDGVLPHRIARANSRGCSHCHEGYAGLLPINEVLPFTRKVKNLAADVFMGVRPRTDLSQKRTVTLLESSLGLLGEGLIDLESLLV